MQGKDPVVLVRCQLIVKTLENPACLVGGVVQLSQLAFTEESDQNFPLKKSQWDNKSGKKKKKMNTPSPQEKKVLFFLLHFYL